MKPKEYPLLREAVEVGVVAGWTRAWKHTDCPVDKGDVLRVHDAISEAVLTEILERFHLEDLPEDPAG